MPAILTVLTVLSVFAAHMPAIDLFAAREHSDQIPILVDVHFFDPDAVLAVGSGLAILSIRTVLPVLSVLTDNAAAVDLRIVR